MPSHGENRGSSPLGDANQNKRLADPGGPSEVISRQYRRPIPRAGTFRPRRDGRHSGAQRPGPSSGQQRLPQGAPRETGTDAMMAYTFFASPIYNAGEVASAWAVAALFFAALALS